MKSADTKITDEQKLFNAISVGDSIKVEALLNAQPTLISVQDEDGNTLLHYAARNYDSQIYRKLGKEGERAKLPLANKHGEIAADIFLKNQDKVKRNPGDCLENAAERGNINDFKHILNRKLEAGDKALTPTDIDKALSLAAEKGHPEIVEAAVDYFIKESSELSNKKTRIEFSNKKELEETEKKLQEAISSQTNRTQEKERIQKELDQNREGLRKNEDYLKGLSEVETDISTIIKNKNQEYNESLQVLQTRQKDLKSPEDDEELQKINTTLKEVQKNQKDLDFVKQVYGSLKEEISIQEKKLKELDEELRPKINYEVQALEDKKAELKEQISEDTKQVQELDKKIKGLETQKQSAEEKLKEAQKQAFIKAVGDEDVEKVKKLLKKRPELAFEGDKDGTTALHYAAFVGNKDLAEAIINAVTPADNNAVTPADNKVNLVNVQNKEGKTPLHSAAEGGNGALVDVLLNNCTELTYTESETKEWSEGEKNKRKEAIKEAKKNYINKGDTNGDNCLVYLAANVNTSEDEELYNELIKLGAQESDKSKLNYQASSLRRDIRGNNKAGIEEKIKSNPGILGVVDKEDKTALHHAVINGKKNIAEILIKNEADINFKDIYGKTPLHYAAENNNEELYSFLIDKGAQENVKDEKGKTPKQLFEEAQEKAEEERTSDGPTDEELEVIDDHSVAASNSILNEHDQSSKAASELWIVVGGEVQHVKCDTHIEHPKGKQEIFEGSEAGAYSKALSDRGEPHIVEHRGPDGKFNYSVEGETPPPSTTRLHTVEGNFGKIVFNAKGEVVSAKLNDKAEGLLAEDLFKRASEVQELIEAGTRSNAKSKSVELKDEGLEPPTKKDPVIPTVVAEPIDDILVAKTISPIVSATVVSANNNYPVAKAKPINEENAEPTKHLDLKEFKEHTQNYYNSNNTPTTKRNGSNQESINEL